jgi:hypothetical protein
VIEVDPVDRDLGITAGDRDARPAEPARKVGDTRGGIAGEAIVDGRHRREPIGREEVVEQRLGEARLALVEVSPVVGVWDSVAGSERFEHGVDRQGTCDKELSHRGHVVEAAHFEEDLVVAGGHDVAAFGVRGAAVLHLEDAGHRLLLQPLARVSLVYAGQARQLGGRRRAPVRECSVHPEPIAQVHAEKIQSPQRAAEEPLDQLVTTNVG